MSAPLPAWSSKLCVALRPARWVEEHAAAQPVAVPLAADLFAVYMLEDADDLTPLSVGQRAELDLSDGQLHVLAVRNVIAKLQPIEREGDDGAWMLSEPGGREESLLFVPAVWEWVSQWLLGDPVACLPSRDVLLVCGADDEPALARLRDAAEAVYADADEPVSRSLLRREGRRWIAA